MTELLYQADSYLQEFEAKVLSVLMDERALVLDRTAFYPGGGGQPCDFGSLTVDGVIYPVQKVKKQSDDILHFLGGDVPMPSVGAVSRGTLDWPVYPIVAAREGDGTTADGGEEMIGGLTRIRYTMSRNWLR